MTGFLLTAKQKLMLCINKRLYSSNSGPSPWDGTLSDGGGTYLGGDPNDTPVWPAGYLVELTAGGTSRQATLLPVEGGAE